MGRFISRSTELTSKAALNGSLKTKIEPAGFMGVFGTGYWKVFWKSGDFIVPPGITKIRVRVVGGGGGSGANCAGGAGGGYAHGVFDTTPGTIYPVVVGAAGSGPSPLSSGGTSSFWTLISATGGGAGGNTTSPAPGIGIGGDFQAKGGTSVAYAGGGAAGSQLGDGGSGSIAGSGGAGVGGNDGKGPGGASAFGSSLTWRGAPDLIGRKAWGPISNGTSWGGSDDVQYRINSYGINKDLEAAIRFPFDGFTGGGGGTQNGIRNTSKPSIGGSGAGGGANGTAAFNYRPAWGGDGGVGGGGGAARTSGGTLTSGEVATSTRGGTGGIGAGGGGSYDPTTPAYGGSMGGQGIVIVEW